MPIAQYIHVRVTDVTKKKVRKLADQRQWSEAQAARHLLELGLKKEGVK